MAREDPSASERPPGDRYSESGGPSTRHQSPARTNSEFETDQSDSSRRPFLHRHLKSLRVAAKDEDPWEQVETPEREVTITLVDSQIHQAVGSEPQGAIVSHTLWQRYLERARALKHDTSDYDSFYRRYRKGAKPKTRIRLQDGKSVEAYGPFSCTLSIGPTPVKTRVYVTADRRFAHEFLLGREDGPVMALKTMHPSRDAPMSEAHVRCKGPGECILTTLVDTGAGPNVLSMEAFLRMGYSPKDLKPNQYKLSMVDNSELVTKGYFPNFRVCLANKYLRVPCTVVDDLGTDDLILGRDFLVKYDVLLDLPRNELVIRNPHGRYATTSSVEEVRDARFLAVPRMETKITPETISCVNYRLKGSMHPGRLRRTRKEGSWLAMVEAADDYYQQKNVSVPKAILTVRDGEATVPLLNASREGGQEADLPSQMGRLKVKLLQEVYKRRVIDEKAKEGSQRFKLDSNGEVIKVITLGMAVNEAEMEHPPEIPIERDDDPPAFPTRPPTEHLTDQLKPENLTELDRLLEEYRDIFCKNKTDIGFTTFQEHDIELVEGAEPHKEAFRRLNPEKRASADQQVEDLLKLGMISPSDSPFASGVVMVRKTDGSYRMCIDFRNLNSVTKKDAFPLPRIDETLDRLGDAKYFSTLDMGSGFWQVPLVERAKERTAFVTHRGQFQWNRMLFGLCNATATFQRLMTKVLANVAQKYGNIVLCYVDDILIATRTQEQHLQQLRAVLSACRAANLKLKAAKCKLFDTEIKFLGRLVTGGGIKPDPESIKTIQDYKPPVSKKQIASFLV